MVQSENFSELIAMIVADDKQGVIQFLRSQGIGISPNATTQNVVKTLFASFNSKIFAERFSKWADNKYKSNNVNFSSANGVFDPMDAQNGGAEINFNGIDFNFGNTNPISSPAFEPAKTKTGAGQVIDSIGGIGGIVDKGWQFWINSEERKKQEAANAAAIRAEEIRLEAILAQGKITKEQMDAQLALLREEKNAPQSQTLLYVIGGIVLLGALGTAIYFATRKKK